MIVYEDGVILETEFNWQFDPGYFVGTSPSFPLRWTVEIAESDRPQHGHLALRRAHLFLPGLSMS